MLNTPINKPLPEVMDSEEVASMLKVSWKTIEKMARNNELRGKQVGRAWRFHRDAIREFLLKK